MGKRFFQFVEIKTKITSVLPFLMTLSYLFAKKIPIDAPRSAVFFAAMFLFDFTATAINNYTDTKTNDQELPFDRPIALAIIISLFLVSAGLGLVLVFPTDIPLLFLGGVCFLFGVLYSYGPVPISRQAYGEFFSGFFYGLMIPLIIIYINSPNGLLFSYLVENRTFILSLNLPLFGSILLLSIIPFCLTANIMLANNICDLDRDIAAKRFTLPFYLGEKSFFIYSALYCAAFLSVPAMVLCGIVSPVCALLFLLIPVVRRNIKRFRKIQDKKTTFPLSIQNFILILSVHTVLIFIGALFPF